MFDKFTMSVLSMSNLPSSYLQYYQLTIRDYELPIELFDLIHSIRNISIGATLQKKVKGNVTFYTFYSAPNLRLN